MSPKDETFIMLPTVLSESGSLQEIVLYLILASKINRSQEPQIIVLEQTRRPTVETTVGPFQCVTGNRKLAEQLSERFGKSIAPSTAGKLLKSLEDKGLIRRETVYYAGHEPEKAGDHGGEAGTKITLLFERYRHIKTNVDNLHAAPRNAPQKTEDRNRSQKPQKSKEIQGFEHTPEIAVRGTIIDTIANKEKSPDIHPNNDISTGRYTETGGRAVSDRDRAEPTPPKAKEPQRPRDDRAEPPTQKPTRTGAWYLTRPAWFKGSSEQWNQMSRYCNVLRESDVRETVEQAMAEGQSMSEVATRVWTMKQAVTDRKEQR